MPHTDCFISYAREDRKFVQNLHDALNQAGTGVWVDWKGILPTANWLQDIRSGIEAAHTFIFVISDDSVGSETCLMELSHAVELNKRLIPVICRDVKDEQIPEALRPLQRIFFRPADSFDQSLQQLSTILDKGLEWLRTERRIGLRAAEWQQKGHDTSLLLLGSALREARDWLTQCRGESMATELHASYVDASVEAASAQLSSHLADLSSELVNKEHDLALLLALEATHSAETVEARRRLLAALQAHPHLDTWLRGPGGPLTSVVFSPDGGLVVAGTMDGRILIWEVASRKGRAHLKCKPSPIAVDKIEEIVDGIAISPDGQHLAAAIQSGVIIWNLSAFYQIGPVIKGGNHPTTSVAFSRDGQLLAFGATDGEIRLLDLTSGSFTPEGTVFPPDAISQPLQGHTKGVSCVVFSPDGAMLASSGRDNMIRLWDLAQRKLIGEPLAGHYEAVPSIAFNPDGRFLASGSFDGTVVLWNVSTRAPQWRPFVHDASGVVDVDFDNAGMILASTARNGTIALWDLSNGKQITQLRGHDSKSIRVAFSPTDDLLASSASDGAVILWNTKMSSLLWARTAAHGGRVSHVEFSPEGNLLATGAWDGRIVLTDLSKPGQPGVALIHDLKVTSFAFSPNGKILAASTFGWVIMLWDVATGQSLGQMSGHQGKVESVAFSPDGKVVASSGWDGSVILWDVASQSSLRKLSVEKNDPIVSVAFSADGQTLAASSQNSIILWDVVSGKVNNSLSGHTDAVTSVAFDASGGILASGSMDQTVQLWDVARLQPLGHPLAGASGTVNRLAFNRSGEMLASAHADGSVNLWDVRSRERIAELLGHASGVNSVAFNPNSRLLASGSCEQVDLMDTHGEVILWVIAPDAARGNACRMANRNLSSEEWQRYFGDEPYRKTCSNLPGAQG